jgi:hypothetical protein
MWSRLTARIDKMSKIKNPAQKKQLSLKRDCRNVYRENPAASRKGIARGKQRRHMDERRTVAQVLAQLKGHVDEDTASNVELQAKLAIADSRNRGFKKVPDEPLQVVIGRKKLRRAKIGAPKP